MNMDLEILFKEAEHEILSRGLKSPETRLNGLKHVKDFMRDIIFHIESVSIFLISILMDIILYRVYFP